MIQIEKNIDLSRYSSFKTGGRAEYFVEIRNREEIDLLANILKQLSPKSILVLGAGSNILFSDDLFEGLIIKNSCCEWSFDNGKLVSDAGVMLPVLAREVSKKNYLGLEHLANIPGTIGGAIRGNVGAYGQSIQDSVVWVDWFDFSKGYKRYFVDDCQFVYRGSIFKKLLNGKGMIVQVGFELIKNIDENIDLLNIIRDDREKRSKDQPWENSCGCFFKNIFLSNENWFKIKNKFGEKVLEGRKIGDYFSSGKIIDWVGLKGKQMGGAQVSPVHANFIVNKNMASSNDIYVLYKTVKEAVVDDLGIELEPEVMIVGKFE